MFSHQTVSGSPSEFLKEDNSIVLTKSCAEKLFSDPDMVGKTLVYDTITLKVTGIIEDNSSNTHIDFDFLFTNKERINKWEWEAFTYCMLSENSDLIASRVLADKILEGVQVVSHYNKVIDVDFQPLADVHLASNLSYELRPSGSEESIYVYSIISLLVPIIVCVNYVNMSFALYVKRGTDIAVSKIFGGREFETRFQFLAESIVLVFNCNNNIYYYLSLYVWEGMRQPSKYEKKIEPLRRDGQNQRP
ncbi:MAG: ABC transporter permease [Bacteroidota bacterium]